VNPCGGLPECGCSEMAAITKLAECGFVVVDQAVRAAQRMRQILAEKIHFQKSLLANASCSDKRLEGCKIPLHTCEIVPAVREECGM
jgi:hypothetical protein